MAQAKGRTVRDKFDEYIATPTLESHAPSPCVGYVERVSGRVKGRHKSKSKGAERVGGG